MKKSSYPEALKQEALRLFYEHGAAEASRRTGIPIATLSSWARRLAQEHHGDDVLATPAEAKLSVAERKGALVLGMLDDVDRLRTQLFAAVVEKKPMVVSQGAALGSVIKVAEVKLSQPCPADQRCPNLCD